MKKMTEWLAWLGPRLEKPPGWERLVRLFSPPEKFASVSEYAVLRDGHLFLAQPSLTLGWNVVMFGTYEPELRAIIRALVPVGGVAVDVGANVGWHTLLMAGRVGAEGCVLALEPNPSVRRRLETHLQLNRLPQVKVLPYALGEKDGTSAFWGPAADVAASGDGHLVAETCDGSPNIGRVEVRRLDSVVSEAEIRRLDLLKVDVEGFEWAVLQGAEETIARFRPHVIFEYNADYASRSECTPQVLERFFAERSYRLFEIQRNWAVPIESGRWPSNADVWAIPSGRP